LAAKKIQSQEAATELKIQENQELHQKVADLQQELQHLQTLYQRIEQLLAEKTKESTEQTTRLTEEQSHREKLQQELTQKEKFLVSEIAVYKAKASQAFLVGFEIVVEQLRKQ